MWEFFKFMVFTFLENAMNLAIFTHVPPHSKLVPKFLSSHPRQKHFFENLFPPTAERGGGNYDLLYQNSNTKHEDDLGHYVIYILYDLQFFQM